MIPPLGLPIEDVMAEILSRLANETRLIVTAPPGAGKTTRIPLALLDQPWMTGKVILVEPRRIAARAAAERMARTIGGRVGETIGLRSRLDVRTSAASRIEVVTEGVFTRIILSDPSLEGISAILFDEVHERSLDGEEGLTLALDAQGVLREDLRIVLMSATLPPGLTRGVFDAAIIASDGRAHEVETRYLGFEPGKRLEDQMAAAISKALEEEEGSILAFLPGAREIQRTAERLEGSQSDVLIAPLYGALSPAEQNAAISPAPAGMRKIVLASDIAESSLTIEGVRVVVDGGFARVPKFDVSLGVSRLETQRVSIANADQRRGRAGRTEPGVCYRLWREAETRGFAPAPSPEVENADLTGLCLDLARWGAKSPDDLKWLTNPPHPAWSAARDNLIASGAIDRQGSLTDLGRGIADLALPPRLAMMVMKAAAEGEAGFAAELAALLSERDLGGRSIDIDERLTRFRIEKGQRANAMRNLARGWARSAGGASDAHGASSGAILAAAFPERIARARGGSPGRFLLASGRGATLEETDPLARSPWLAIAELTGAGPDLRITLAARLSEEDALRVGQAATSEEARYDPAARAIRARRTRRLGAIVLEDAPLPSPAPELIEAGFLSAIREFGLSLIPERGGLEDLIARVDFLGKLFGEPWPHDFRGLLTARLDDWLPTALRGVRALDKIESGGLADAARSVLDRPLSRELERLAPSSWTTPAGRRIAIDYAAPGGPLAECRVQDVYGLSTHPALAEGRAPLTLALLSPAQRPVALTKDLPGFWRGGYHDMRRDMKGRYPKHEWPDDPASAAPSLRPRRKTQ